MNIEAIDVDDAWDTGELGQTESAVRVAAMTPEQYQAIDDAVGLQMISIRLPKSLIEDYKFLGEVNGIKYQILMRQILARFAQAEMKSLASKAANAQIKQIKKAARQGGDKTSGSDDGRDRTRVA